MYINELAEAKVLVIFGGRFQPFHQGHAWVYNYLVGKFGRQNVYIGTTGKVEPLKTPFTLSERVYFMNLQGVPSDRIVQIPQNYSTEAIQQAFNISNEAQSQYKVLFAVSEKDMAEDPRFQRWTKKDGTPSKLQKMPDDLSQVQTMDKHGYILTVPTKEFTVLGKVCTGASDIRALYEPADEKTRQQIIADVFGKYTREAEQIFNSRLLPAAAVEPTRPNKLPKTVKPVGGQVVEPVSEDSDGTPAVDSKRYALLTKARIAHPVAKSDVEALALYINDKEERDVGHLDQVNDREDDMIDHLEKLEMDLQAQISNLQHKFDSEKVKEETREPYQQSIDRLESSRIDQLNSLMDEIKQRFATEKMPANYREALKQRLDKLKAERDSYYGVR